MRYFVVEMPLTVDGNGPAVEGEVAKTVWEVWNQDLVYIAEFDTREMAERAAQIINEDLEGAVVRGR